MVSISSSIRKSISLKEWLGIEIIAKSVTLSAIENFQHGTLTDVEQLKTTDH